MYTYYLYFKKRRLQLIMDLTSKLLKNAVLKNYSIQMTGGSTMSFIDANILFSEFRSQVSELNNEEKAIVDFYETSLAFSRAIVNYRLANSINQNELAKKIGTTQSHIMGGRSGLAIVHLYHLDVTWMLQRCQ